jgi:hypothetical protein
MFALVGGYRLKRLQHFLRNERAGICLSSLTFAERLAKQTLAAAEFFTYLFADGNFFSNKAKPEIDMR